MPLIFKMLALAAAFSSALAVSSRFADQPPSPPDADADTVAFDDRWQGVNHAVLLAAVSSRSLAGIVSPAPAAARVDLPKATAADLQQHRSEKLRAQATYRRATVCVYGKRYYRVGGHKYWRCKRR